MVGYVLEERLRVGVLSSPAGAFGRCRRIGLSVQEEGVGVFFHLGGGDMPFWRFLEVKGSAG